MSAPEDVLLANNQRIFVLKALLDGLRPDGRFLHECRKTKLTLRRYEDATNAEVALGKTRVTAVITATLGAPFGDRGNEGTLSFNVTAGPLAGPQHEVTRASPLTAELSRMLERAIRDSRAVDLEALCVVPGARVWGVRVDVHVLCDDGNVPDASSLATIAALMHFRRPDVTVHDDGRVTVHAFAERPPLPLSLHHTPVAVTLGLFASPAARLRQLDFAAASAAAAAGSAAPALSASAAAAAAAAEAAEGSAPACALFSPAGAAAGAPEVAVMDPSLLEEQVIAGRVTFVMNAFRELCGVHKLGGVALAPADLVAATAVAGVRAQELVGIARAAVAAAEKEAAAREASAVFSAAVGAPAAGTLQVDVAGTAGSAAAGGAGAGAAAAATSGGQ